MADHEFKMDMVMKVLAVITTPPWLNMVLEYYFNVKLHDSNTSVSNFSSNYNILPLILP